MRDRDSVAPAGVCQNRDNVIAAVNDDELDPFMAGAWPKHLSPKMGRIQGRSLGDGA